MENKKAKEKSTIDLRHIFTAYVLRAVKNRRYDYIRCQKRRLQLETLKTEPCPGTEVDYADEFEKALPLQMQLENDRLLVALKGLSVRERDIFLGRVLDEMSFSTLAERVGLTSAGAASTYYRAVRKLRQKMGEQDR